MGIIKWGVAGLALAAALSWGVVQARMPAPTTSAEVIALAELPLQGVQVYRRIHQGGPFVSEKDGSVFGNRERLLPIKRRGYYLEYTVPTPGARNRGVRRIVCGGQPKLPDACYYTADHYESFRQIVP